MCDYIVVNGDWIQVCVIRNWVTMTVIVCMLGAGVQDSHVSSLLYVGNGVWGGHICRHQAAWDLESHIYVWQLFLVVLFNKKNSVENIVMLLILDSLTSHISLIRLSHRSVTVQLTIWYLQMNMLKPVIYCVVWQLLRWKHEFEGKRILGSCSFCILSKVCQTSW